MNNRVRQFWLPGLLTITLSMGLLAVAEIYGPKPWILRSGNPPVMVVHIPWLLGLPVVGAIGAFLSRRAGGSRRAVFSSIVFPVVPYLAAILFISPVVLSFDHFIAHSPMPASIPMAVLGLVLTPGVALLAGGLPAQLFFSRRLDSRRIASR